MDTRTEAGRRRRRTIYGKILRETGTTYVGTLIGLLIGYANVILITRWLTPEEYGLYSLGLTVVGLCGVLATLSLHDALVRYIPSYQASGRQDAIRSLLRFSFSASLVAGIVFLALLVLFGPWLSTSLFRKPLLGDVLRLLAPAVPCLVLILMTGHAFMGWKEMRYMVYLQRLCQPLTQFAMILLFSLLATRLYGLLASYLIALGTTALLAVWLLRTKLQAPAGRRPADRREILRYAYPLLGNRTIVFLLNGCIDILLLGYFLPAESVGQYKIAQLAIQPLGFVMFSFALIGKPVLAELMARGDWGDVQRIYQRVSKWIVCLNLPLFVILASVGPQILTLFFTDRFSGGATALTVLSLGLLLNALCGPEGKALDASGHTRWLLVNAASALVLNLVLSLLLIPRLGIEGAAVAVSAGLLLQGVMGLTQLRLRHGVHPFSPYLARTLVAGLALLAASRWAAQWVGPQLVPVVGFGGGVLLAWLLLLKGFRVLDGTDADILKSFLSRVRGRAAG